MNRPYVGNRRLATGFPPLTTPGQTAIMVTENQFQLAIGMRFTENRITSLLRQRGYKLTPQRRQVINAIALSHEHLTPAAIYEKVHQQHPTIGRVTIYRTLDILTGLGLLCEVHVEGSCHSYLLRRPAEHHHHLICSDCGAVEDFTSCDLNELEHKLSQQTGFDINSHLLEFSGLCPDCRQTARGHTK